jgi:hypothetical protein
VLVDERPIGYMLYRVIMELNVRTVRCDIPVVLVKIIKLKADA